MKTASRVLAVIAIGALFTGCPPRDGDTRVIAALTSGAAKDIVEVIAADANVETSAIQSLVVDVTGITLDSESEENAVVLYSGSMEVDLLDLTGVSQVISNAQVEAGTYTKVRLNIDNPRLRLVAAPDVEITDIQLTANGRLFVSQSFEVPEGQTSLILMDFGGVHLVQQGNGGYTLTPQLQVDLSVQNAEVTLEGNVLTNDVETQTLSVDLGGSVINVTYTGADIYLVDDTDVPNGVDVDLAAGVSVQVNGILQADGSVVADAIFMVE